MLEPIDAPGNTRLGYFILASTGAVLRVARASLMRYPLTVKVT
jgi:hypothetical protein